MYSRFILIALLLILAGKAYAQSVITPALTDTLQISEVDEHEQLTYLKDSGTPLTAVVVDCYASGQLKLRRSVVAGKAEGVWIEWYENGIPRYIAEWRNGKGDGLWLYFHENGQLRTRETVQDNIW